MRLASNKDGSDEAVAETSNKSELSHSNSLLLGTFEQSKHASVAQGKEVHEDKTLHDVVLRGLDIIEDTV